MRIFFTAAFSIAVMAVAVMGEGAVSVTADSGKAKAVIIDSAKAKASGADTSAKTAAAKPDSSARGGDTSAVSQLADTVISDTSAANASAVDTSDIDTSTINASTADTVSTAFGNIDTARLAAAADSLFAFEETEKKPLFADSKLFKWAAANIFYILFFCASVLLIAAAVYYFVTRKDARRFLTTTRLSVLDKMVQRGCRYIESNYADPNLSVDAVARELITGAAYLDALFVKEVGIDVHDFIMQVRVNSIKNFLAENPSADIESACARSGFSDRAEAERCFKRLCKVEIWEYIKSQNL